MLSSRSRGWQLLQSPAGHHDSRPDCPWTSNRVGSHRHPAWRDRAPHRVSSGAVVAESVTTAVHAWSPAPTSCVAPSGSRTSAHTPKGTASVSSKRSPSSVHPVSTGAYALSRRADAQSRPGPVEQRRLDHERVAPWRDRAVVGGHPDAHHDTLARGERRERPGDEDLVGSVDAGHLRAAGPVGLELGPRLDAGPAVDGPRQPWRRGPEAEAVAAVLHPQGGDLHRHCFTDAPRGPTTGCRKATRGRNASGPDERWGPGDE